MENYFLLPNLLYDAERIELENYVKTFPDWSFYGYGRFRIFIGFPTRESIIPVASKFKNPKTLFKKIEINMVKANGIVAPHTDCDRFATLNIPIMGDFENSTLDFYTHNTDGEVSPGLDGNQGALYKPKHYIEEELIEQVSYTVPVCFDTQTVHGVTNCTKQDRYILALSFREEFTYAKLKEMYEYGDLLV
jgi:hypothetical protein